MNRRKLSIAIPVYNEQSVLPELYRRLRDVLDDLAGWHGEIVFVDDGSCDGSEEILEALVGIDPRVRVVRLSRNFGHQAALTAALDYVSGDAVVLMDGDLQDSPEAIPRLLEQFEKGYDVVYAVRTRRKERWPLRICYATFYRLIRWLAEIDLPQGAGDFGILSRRVVDELRRAPERHRYLRGLRRWVGFRQRGIAVERAPRHSGKPKYGLRKLLRLAADGIFSFSLLPLRAATAMGLLLLAATMVGGPVCLWFVGWPDTPGRGLMWLAWLVLVVAAVQLISIGVLGEYVGRVYQQVQQRPHYIVDRVIGAEDESLAGRAAALLAATPEPTDPPPQRCAWQAERS